MPTQALQGYLVQSTAFSAVEFETLSAGHDRKRELIFAGTASNGGVYGLRWLRWFRRLSWNLILWESAGWSALHTYPFASASIALLI